MKGRKTCLNFYKDKIYFSNGVSLAFNQIHGANILKEKPFQKSVHFVLEAISEVDNEGKLHFEILKYNTGIGGLPNEINRIDFGKVKTISFKNIDTDPVLKLRSSISTNVSQPSKTNSRLSNLQREFLATNEEIHTYNQLQKIKIRELNFLEGCVEFYVFFKEINKKVKLEIKNEFIKKEFDALKEYFEKVFKRKTIEVKAEVKIKDGEVTSAIARNEVIEGIDESLIKEVKLSRLKKIEKEFEEGELLTFEDLKAKAKEKKISGVELIADIDELLEEILNYSKSKHYNHVKYLSKLHNSDKMKLRFILNQFSYLFLVSSGDNNYFIWETLKTKEATYMWKFNNNKIPREQFKEVEQILNEIKSSGKHKYLSKAKENFIKIHHDYSPNGFEKWKQELHEKIV